MGVPMKTDDRRFIAGLIDGWTEKCNILHIDVYRMHTIVVLELRGELQLGEPTSRYRQAMAAVVTAGENFVVLDLRLVRKIDTAGLGCITESLTQLEAIGGLLTIVRPATNYLGALLVETKLDTIACVSDRLPNAIDELLRKKNAG